MPRETIQVQVYNAADEPQGEKRVMTEGEVEELVEGLPAGWYTTEV